MHDAAIIKAIEGKYIELLDDLDERGRRRWAAVEARVLGRGGITAVARATGLSDRTIRTGLMFVSVATMDHVMIPATANIIILLCILVKTLCMLSLSISNVFRNPALMTNVQKN